MDYRMEYFKKFRKLPPTIVGLYEKSEIYQKLLKQSIENNKEMSFNDLKIIMGADKNKIY